MEPIETITWQCPICKTIYTNKDDAIACANKPNPVPRFQVGDIVYLQESHPRDETKSFVRRTITKVCGVFKDVGDTHRVGYNLDEIFCTGGGSFIGGWREWEADYQPALEDYLYRLGDRREIWNHSTQGWEDNTLTEDMVQADF